MEKEEKREQERGSTKGEDGGIEGEGVEGGEDAVVPTEMKKQTGLKVC